MKIVFSLLLFVVGHIGQAQITVRNLPTVDSLQIFPLLRSSSKPIVAEKINDYLQLEYLEITQDSLYTDPFDRVKKEYRSFFEAWRVMNTPPNIFSIEISGGGTGAYTSFFIQHHNFDSRTGRFIQVDTIFTQQGYKAVDSIVNQKVTATLVGFIDSVSLIANPDERELMQIENYIECKERVDPGDLQYHDFYFLNDTICFTHGECFPHAIQALDDLGEFVIFMKLIDIKPYLSEYGRRLFDLVDEKNKK